MARSLAKSTLNRLRVKLEAERVRLTSLLDEMEREREASRLAQAASDHSADPDNVDGGSLAAEMEIDFSVERNARALLEKVSRALLRMDKGTYGVCEVSGKPIPVARLEALPYASTLVEYADRA